MKKSRAIGEMAEADMTPMIDMTFQLIAFFMILINFSEAEQNNRIKLPISVLAKPQSKKIEKFITLHVDRDRINEKGDFVKSIVYFGGREYDLDAEGSKDSKSSKGIRKALLNKAKSFTGDGVEKADVLVIVRADGDAETGKVQDLIKLCKDPKIGFSKFALRAERKK